MDRNLLLNIAVSLVGVGPSTAPALYNLITEGRKSSPKRYYGWCGDYVSYCLMRAGVVDGTILNRAALNGEWVPADNLTRIERWAKKAGALTRSFIKPGDIVVNPRSDGDHTAICFATPGGPWKQWLLLNGNGKGGVVSIGGLPSSIRYIVDVDYMPIGVYKGTGKVQPKAVQGGGNP